jgi:hypothetical protein
LPADISNNQEPNKHKPARIALGDPLPTETPILPEPDQLIAHAPTPQKLDLGINGGNPNGLDDACKRASLSEEYVAPPSPNGGAPRDEFEERAAILEFEAGLSREEAERLAGLNGQTR